MAAAASNPVSLSQRDPRRKAWIAFAILCASLLVDLALYLPSHHSTALIVLAVVTSLVALGGMAIALVIAFRLTPAGLVALRQHAARGRMIYLVIGFTFAFGFGLEMRPEWVYAHIGLMLASLALLGYELLYADAPPLPRWWIVVAGIAAIAVTLLRISGLSVYPVVNINDEPWDLAWALSYLQKGYFTDPIMYYGGFDIQRFMLPVAWWISLVGVGFWQVRLFFFLLIFPLMGLTALTAHNLYGSGRIAALVMFSSAVVMVGGRIRHDIGLALAVAACLWLYSEGLKRRQLIWHFLAGLVIGLGWFAHYHAIGFGVVLAIALYLPNTIERWRQGNRLPEIGFGLFVLGGLIGALLVFVFQILPDWAGFLGARQPRNPQSLLDFGRVFFAYWGNIVFFSQFELLLILAAIAAACWRRQRSDIMLVLLVLLLHLALAIQASEPYPQYLLQISPVYGLLLTGLLTRGLGTRKIAYGGVAAGLFMLINLGVTLQSPLLHLVERQPLELPMPPVAAWIRANVSPSERIVTEHWYYLWLTDYDFISPLSPVYAHAAFRLPTNEAMWDQIAPQVVIIDRNLSTCCVQEPIYDTAYLQSRGYHEITELPGDRYPVLVYEKGKAP